ncbi:MAG: dihydropteroate synthase [Phycisphaerae bacterium]|jgi:dihydropteroate synthase
MVRIFGIVNVTRDSFSDGGRCLDPAAAIAHARRLLDEGADVIDVGAESTHPDAEDVPAEEQIARLAPVIEALKARGVAVSVDAYQPAVIREALRWGADYVNDVTALRDPEAVRLVRDAPCGLILMHSRCASARAERGGGNAANRADAAGIVYEIIEFFRRRLDQLAAQGIARPRLILDPGMGYFLGADPRLSFEVLRGLPRLRSLGCPLLVSTSRKSFIGAMLGGADAPRPVDGRAVGTVVTELWAALQGVEYVRTHDARALRDALTVWSALRGSDRPEPSRQQ